MPTNCTVKAFFWSVVKAFLTSSIIRRVFAHTIYHVIPPFYHNLFYRWQNVMHLVGVQQPASDCYVNIKPKQWWVNCRTIFDNLTIHSRSYSSNINGRIISTQTRKFIANNSGQSWPKNFNRYNVPNDIYNYFLSFCLSTRDLIGIDFPVYQVIFGMISNLLYCSIFVLFI